ncbi:immunoglobulin superfamily member 6 [Salminus brasiliensis]|uniref:immunoglobulin superfamily member 6 n=1 Tax=Salminus brasiliensis TaxID=930266 RepID=UPI003B83239F
MALYLFFQIASIAVFTSELSVSGCHVEVSQPQELLFGDENHSLSISCHINMSTCKSHSHKVLWYVFTSNSHRQLDTKNQPLKYQLKTEENHLQINDLTTSDDGAYYCAVALNGMAKSGEQAFGSGTTVKVKVHGRHTGRAVLLALMVLLALLGITILTYIICMKTGRHTLFIKGRFRTNDAKIDSSKRVHFGVVVQELYSKRNLRKKSASSEVSPENKFENPRSQTDQREDIYQNLKRTG